ncbi:MAG: uroporphyrinogen decarboxylase family protein [Lentisphaeria bacterium]|nr:uroporphyrinogen decarboxylase family protein [Lentisphaeria bacterium]
MTPRQRTLETLLFGAPDRVPLTPGGGRESTRQAWYSQGLSPEIRNYAEHAYRLSGGRLPWPTSGPGFPVNERMIPYFEEKVIEVKEQSQVVQDWKGNVCEIGLEFDTEYLRNARDFVTRRWIKCPVESEADWDAMKTRYDTDDPSRLPADPDTLKQTLATRDWFVEIHFSGPFWQLREWCGFEGLCVMFYDNPALVKDMIAFWTTHVARLLERTLAVFTPDCVHLSEDMAYKSFAMISPAMTREYLLPTYHAWGEIIRSAGVPIYAMDSDGFIGELIPIWMEAGINVCDPIEVAAGNDIVAFREQFGRKMAFRGGVDKRAMAKGGTTIEDEINRLRPVIDSGGFIPSCDHAIPADVSWPNFVDYVKLLAQATGWL